MELDYVIRRPPHFARCTCRPCTRRQTRLHGEAGGRGPGGIRKILAAGEQADKKKLCVVAGTQRRHEASYIEAIKRIHDGEIGRIYSAQAYWDGGPLAYVIRDPSMSTRNG